MRGKLKIISAILAVILVLGMGNFPVSGPNVFPVTQAYAETVMLDKYGPNGGAGQPGGDVTLNNEISGTTDPVQLYQNAWGGAGGQGDNSAPAGKGGPAGSILTWPALTGATATTYEVKAYGGSGGGGYAYSAANGGAGGDAQAGFSLIGSGDITGTAVANGGPGGSASGSGSGGAGGLATLGQVYGESTNGGTVNIIASATNGNGGGAGGGYIPSSGSGGSGAAISLHNAANGETAGSLTLSQRAGAGSGGGVPYSNGTGGQAGSAESVLSYSKNAGYLFLDTLAGGGSGGSSYIEGSGSDGKAGAALTEATNTGPGAARAQAIAGGGSGGSSALGGPAGQGGAAEATARAVSTASWAEAATQARGGDGGTGSTGRAGGAAQATSEATTGVPLAYPYLYGGSVTSDAFGGNGGHGVGSGGAGGAATAASTYTYNGSQDAGASISAGAQGGHGGQGQNGSGGAGGNARATATGYAPNAGLSVGSGATGGVGGYSYSGLEGKGGEALATSTGTAASGLVYSTVVSYNSVNGAGQPDLIGAQAGAAINNGTSVSVAGTNVGEITKYLGDVQDKQAAAFGTARPTQTSLAPLLASNLQVQAAFGPGSEVFSYGVLGRTYVDSGGVIYTSSLQCMFPLGNISNPQHLLVGLLDSNFTGSGFGSLEFTITGVSQQPYTMTFTSAGEALSFFDDRVLDLGPITALPNNYGVADLTFGFSLVAAEGASFNFNFIEGNGSLAPVPGGVWLLGSGLLGLGVLGRRRIIG